MNIKERKDLQQELLGIVFNILVESEDSTIETMELRAVEIIKKIKEHINDDIEHGTGFDSQKMPILDWIVACDSQNHVRLNNKSLLKFEKKIKDVGGRSKRNSRGYVGGERETFLNFHFFENVNERRARNYERLDHVLNQPRRVLLSNRDENIVRQRTQEILNNIRDLDRAADRELFSRNRSENIRRPGEQMQPSEVSLNLSENRDEYTIMRERKRAGRRMRPNFVRREREVPLSSKIGQLIVVVSSIIVGAFIGTMVGMVIAGLCIELCVITTAEPILLIMGATAVIGAIVAGTAPVLKLIEMFKGQEPNLSPSSGLESSNTEHTYLNRQRVI
ncbi:hypothetical protein [Wolbachia endosymbiont (group B) of Erebia ligea]|uniref:hypothetical protein n=1 Tax=Wolbachia endosymbiont (group B) of Erebia ligea TaxID=2954010 RepID=UPI0021F8B5AC|nr:hypothetical protein [Wolbachia endosymbiont (group B) of Erebia ligea]